MKLTLRHTRARMNIVMAHIVIPRARNVSSACKWCLAGNLRWEQISELSGVASHCQCESCHQNRKPRKLQLRMLVRIKRFQPSSNQTLVLKGAANYIIMHISWNKLIIWNVKCRNFDTFQISLGERWTSHFTACYETTSRLSSSGGTIKIQHSSHTQLWLKYKGRGFRISPLSRAEGANSHKETWGRIKESSCTCWSGEAWT